MAGKKRTEVEHVWLRNEIFQRFLMFSFHWDIVRETEGFCTKMIWHGYTEIMAQNRQITNPNHNTSEHVFFSSFKQKPTSLCEIPTSFSDNDTPSLHEKGTNFSEFHWLGFCKFF